MASTIRVRDGMHRVSVALNDIDPQFVGWSERELVDWFNDGQLVLATYLPAMCSRIDSIKLKPGTLQSIDTIATSDCKQADGTTPAQPIRGKMLLHPICTMGADGLSPGTALRMGNRKQIDAQAPDWHTKTGPVRQVFFDPVTPKHFFVSNGVPSSGATWIRIAYTAEPTRIPNTGTPGAELYGADSTNTTTFSVDDECVQALVDYVCARAKLNDSPGADPQAAATFVALFTSWVNAKSVAMTGHNPNLKRLPMMPEPAAAAA